MTKHLTATGILRLFELLNEELAKSDTHAELALVGGAVMCVALNARESTRDVDALFKPVTEVRAAAARVGPRVGAPPDWLNDAVKGFISPAAEFEPWLELSHLKVSTARPEYMLAMKCAAMRLGEGFRDLDDIRYLLRYLNITDTATALAVVTRYFDEKALPAKTRLALEELLDLN